MNVLIVKLGATGDVIRTTTLLSRFDGNVTWVTDAKNKPLIDGTARNLHVLDWGSRAALEGKSFDLVINLEDDVETASILKTVHAGRLFGAYEKSPGQMAYTEDARKWFDLSLISVHGRDKADKLKFQNRSTYQHLIFEGLGWKFSGEKYFLPSTADSDMKGDVAIASEAGPVWPMKKWAHFDWLKTTLESQGLVVNYLQKRPTMLEHLADVRAHRCLISGDSLPMHLALGSGVPCVALFTCTSPWEIHDYGLLTKLVSPLLE